AVQRWALVLVRLWSFADGALRWRALRRCRGTLARGSLGRGSLGRQRRGALVVLVVLVQLAGAGAGLLCLLPERSLTVVEALGDVVLLADAQDRLADVVDDETGWQE